MRTFKLKINYILIILITIFITLIVASALYGLITFFDTYRFQNPVILRSPIYKMKSNVVIEKSSKSAEMIFDVGKIADKIYTLESSNGRNDSCRNLGLYNGYGYRQNSFEWICYSSHEEVRQLVITWLTKHIKNGDIKSALCMYNQGKITDNCSYAINYESL